MALVEDSMNRNKFESFRSREVEIRQRGKLKIFFGIASGVGKTYSMLKAASVYLSKGFDIVIGGIDTHNSTYLNDLVEKFEVIPYRQIEHNQPTSFDIDLKKLYNEIYSASVHLNNEIDNMFNISAIELGKINVNIDWHDIKDIFNNVVNDLKEELSLFRLDIVLPATMPLVRIDSKLMNRALYNLVENSCRYSQPNTTIRLKAFYDNGTLVIQEMDRGESFELNQLPLAFTKFNKVRNQLKDKSSCNLFIVKKLVEY